MRRGGRAAYGGSHVGVSGEVTLPPSSEMREQIAAYDAGVRKRYVASKRHTIQVDARSYREELERERRTRRT